MKQGNINILMTGGGAPGAAGILRCLQRDKRFHIHLADANPDAVGSHLKVPFSVIPLAIAPLFTDSLLELCTGKNISLILPLVTRELVPLAVQRSHFEKAGIKIPISSVESLGIANNKSRLYEFLQWRGMEVPDFRVVETVEQFKTAVIELGYPGKQICFKPSSSNGSRGFRILSGHINELDLLFNQKPFSAYITYEDAVRILSTGIFPELLVSEWLPGEEFSVDCLAKNGESILVLPRSRKKTINGISVEGEFIKEESITSYCTQIIKELKLHGNIGIQVKRAATGKFLILEINPRVQGTISSALGAGINLPLLAVKQELGLPAEASELDVKWGTKFSRYWEEIFY